MNRSELESIHYTTANSSIDEFIPSTDPLLTDAELNKAVKECVKAIFVQRLKKVKGNIEEELSEIIGMLRICKDRMAENRQGLIALQQLKHKGPLDPIKQKEERAYKFDMKLVMDNVAECHKQIGYQKKVWDEHLHRNFKTEITNVISKLENKIDVDELFKLEWKNFIPRQIVRTATASYLAYADKETEINFF